MKLIYRISDVGYKKEKPHYINNENCFNNFFNVFGNGTDEIIVIADNISKETENMLLKKISPSQLKHVSVGHGAGTFNLALDLALEYHSDGIVYFIENDYIHRPMSRSTLIDGFNVGGHFVSLYDHPDKYINGANPLVEDGGEVTRVMLGNMAHWKLTNSTTMTFAAKVKTLKETESVLRKYTNESYPRDFEMFLKLRANGYSLITPIPSYSTHGETAWLAPHINWEEYI